MSVLLSQLRAASALLLIILLAACGGGEEEAPEMPAGERLVLKGAGATFPAPLYQRWAEEYEKVNPEVDIVYDSVGSGEGIKRFIAESVDFGASDAAMKDSEISQVARGVRMIPVTAGMVVLAYNVPGVGSGLNLPREVYTDIFRGDIYRWDDARIAAANPGVDLPHKLIQVVGRRDSSGTTFAFTNHLAAVDNTWENDGPGVGKLIDWPGGAMTSSGNAGVAQRIKITLGSIGYVEYGFARRLGLPVAALENKSGEFVAPDAGSGQSGLDATPTDIPADLRMFITDPGNRGAYPIVSYSWLLLYERYDNAQKSAALRDAVAWGLQDGQAIAEEMGYIPLPASVVQRARSALSQVN